MAPPNKNKTDGYMNMISRSSIVRDYKATRSLGGGSTHDFEVAQTQSGEYDSGPFYLIFDRDLRKAGATQVKIAKELAISQQAVSKWRANNNVPVVHRRALAKIFYEMIGDASHIYQLFKNDQLVNSISSERHDERANANQIDRKHQTAEERYVSAEKYLTNQADPWTDKKDIKSEQKSHRLLLDTHNAWLTEATRQFTGVEKQHLYCDNRGLKAVFDLAIPHLRTYITCVGTFKGYKPVRELRPYSIQLLKLCAMFMNSKQSGRYSEPLNIVVLNGICWRDKPTENELAVQEWLECVGISMIHAHSYQDAMIAVSHFYCQSPSTDSR